MLHFYKTSVLLKFFITLGLQLLVLVTSLAQELNDLRNVPSIAKLGESFVKEVPVKKINGAKVLLFNDKLADALGIKYPKDPAQLEKMLLDLFAYEVTKPSNKVNSFFNKLIPNKSSPIETRWVSYYQDSGSKGQGEALGDGRAFWTGEFKTSSGKSIDVVQKGIGVTPLAWLNHNDPAHKDGLQSIEEAVHSYLMSDVNLKNQLDSTLDLAVILIPSTKSPKFFKTTQQAAITVRVGNQTRLSHFRFHSDHPKNFKTIADYIIRRDLMLPENAVISPTEVVDYLKKFASNLGEESARYFDLHAVHGSPTSGNRTTQGSTIDLGTFHYSDAQHKEYSYLHDRLKLGSQNEQMIKYINSLIDYFKKAGYHSDEVRTAYDYKRIFWESYDSQIKKLALARLGIPESQMGHISDGLKNRWLDWYNDLYLAMSERQHDLYGKKMKAARYKPRQVLSRLLKEYFADPKTLKQRIEKILVPNTQWKEVDTIQKRAPFFAEKAQSILDQLNEELFKNLSLEDKNSMIQQALTVNQAIRLESWDTRQLSEQLIHDEILKGSSFTEISQVASNVASQLADPGLVPRHSNQFGKSISFEKSIAKKVLWNVFDQCLQSAKALTVE